MPLRVDCPGGTQFSTGEWMHLDFRPRPAMLVTSFMLLALTCHILAQVPTPVAAEATPVQATVVDTPDAPQPQLGSASVEPLNESGSASQIDTAQQTPASPAAESEAEKSQHDQAQEQLQQQMHQRVMGVMATFNTTTNRNALPLSPGQKFQLFFKSSTDPWPFLLAGAVAGIGQAEDSYSEWGQGAEGYAKRFGAAYSDAFIGNFFGNAVLPVMLHEDPRYFQKGTGSLTTRFLWAASSTVWCKRDKGGWGPNYANVGGNLIGAAIARVYYPASERTVSDTINDGLTVSVEGIVGAELIEFWPDVVRHYKRKHAEKMAQQPIQGDTQAAPQAAP
jgi:hypothetical protein